MLMLLILCPSVRFISLVNIGVEIKFVQDWSMDHRDLVCVPSGFGILTIRKGYIVDISINRYVIINPQFWYVQFSGSRALWHSVYGVSWGRTRF